MNTINQARLQHEFMSNEFGQTDCMDAVEMIPAGSCFGGDAPMYTGAMQVVRPGYFAQSEIDNFAALFA